MKTSHLTIVLLLAAMPLFSTPLAAAPVVADWSATAATLADPSDTGVRAEGTNLNTGVHASLLPAGGRYVLANDGDSLTMTGVLSLGGSLAVATAHAGALRFGLYDSAGSSGTTGWHGRFALFDTAGTGGTPGGLLRRTGGAQDFWSGTGTTRIATYDSVESALLADTDYTVSLTLTKIAGGLRIAAHAAHASDPARVWLAAMYDDATPGPYAFDRAGFFVGSGAGAETLTIKSLDLVAVPEPRTALVAVGGLGALAWRRYRRIARR